jgi:FkbM family methyltransferase
MNVRILDKSFDVANEPADFWSWVNDGAYDSEWRLMQSSLRSDHTFIDLGAWVGGHSLYASTLCKTVYAVEPDPVAFQILYANTFHHPNITRDTVAITGYTGKIKLGSGLLGASTTRVNPNAGGGIGPWEPGQQFDADCMTLREFCADIPDPLFIKMDVEGSEEVILQDEDFFASRMPTLMLEVHPFWWKDVGRGWRSVDRIAKLYDMKPQRTNRILMVGK